MDISQRKDIIVFALIVILAFLIGHNWIYKSGLNKMYSLNKKLEEEKKENIILGDVGLLNRKLQLYQERSFSTTEITELLDKVSELAKQAGIKIETYNPLPVVYKEQYVELRLEIPLRSEYHKLGEFLSLIESNPEFIWVKGLNMQKSTVTSSKAANMPKIDLTLSGLYLKK